MVIDFFRPLAGGGHLFIFFQTVAGSEKFPCGGIRWRWVPQMMNSFSNSFFGTNFKSYNYGLSGTEGV